MIRFSPSRLALSHIALGALALALFAIPLGYGYRANLGTFRAYVPGAEMQRLVDIFHRDGPQAAAAAVDAYLPSMPRDEVLIFVDPEKRRLAGSLPAWPAEVPDVPGTYGLVIGLGGEASMRVVTSHVTLPGGYQLLMGRESVRFDSLVARFWYGIAGAVAIVLTLGLAFAWLLRRERGQLEGQIAQRTAALRLSEERYARVMQASEDGFWEWIVATDEFYASPRMLAIYGLPPDTVFRGRKDFLSRFPFHPEDLDLWRKAVAAHLAGETARVDLEVRAKLQGQMGWIHLTAICLRDASGAEERWTGSVSDVTERRRAQEALRRSEERYARAMEGSDAGHWDWNIVTDEMFVSERARDMLALPPGALPQRRTDIMQRVPMHPEDRAAMNGLVNVGIRSGNHERDYRVIPRPGEVRWVRSRAKVYRDERGVPMRMTGSLIDITERKLATDALRASEERYSLAMEASEEGHFDVNLDTDEHFTSERLNEIHGFPPGTRTAKRSEYMKHVRFYGDDAEKYRAAIAAAEAKDGPERYECEFRIVRPSGEVRWLRTRGKVMRDAEGRARRRTGVVADVTARKIAEEALRLSEQRYAIALEVAEEGNWDWNVQTDEIYASPQSLRVLGIPQDAEYRTRGEALAHARLHPDDAPRISSEWRAALAGRGVEHEFEYRILRDAEPRWIRSRWKIFRDDTGVALRVIGVVADVTERKRAENELRESEARFRALTELSSDWYWQQDENLRFTYLSGQVQGLTGYSGESSLGKLRWEVDDMTPLSCSWAEHQAVLAARQPFRDLECRRVGPDGTVRYLSISGAPVFDAQGEFRGYRGIGRNITARKQAEQALRESEARKSAMFETALDCIVSIDHEGRVVEFNPAAERTFGYRRAEALGKELAALIIPPRLRAQHRQGLARYLKSGEGPVLGRRTEMPAVRADGSEFPVELSVTRIATEGAPLFTAYLRDITERKRVEEALRQSEERYALAVAGSNEGIFDWDLVSDRVYVSHRAQELFGLPRGELWRPRRDWRHILAFHPDDAPRLHDSIKAHIEGGAPTYDEEFRIVVPGGGVRWFRQRGIALRDASGKAYRMVGSIGDVTLRRQAEEELKAMERKLRQAQRLEAMGTLAGGIAHDFNNILGAILGYGEMALRDAAKGSRLRRDLDSIVTAGERGRALVDRVLAFSRSGVGERVAVNVEKVAREALDLVSAKLPENVTLHAKLHAGPAAMLGDATQVHQVLMNLATNAVQAMPAGGTLRVSLDTMRVDAPRATTIGNVTTGEYVVLKVADTGSGIAPEILDRIFDPFFTTKEVGTGTGLGLSLVHGIVSELGGAVDVASTVGAGSTFTVYLPRSGDALDSFQKEEPELPRGGGQRVLVVDDEEPLVRLATRTLEELGYAPVGFTSSAAALAAFRADPQRFDAVITDERMPGMSGSALIREVRGIRDGIPIVLMSGYIGGAVATRAREAGAEEVLKKPLSARDLAASLARVLHA